MICCGIDLYRNTYLEHSSRTDSRKLEARPLILLENSGGGRPPEFKLFGNASEPKPYNGGEGEAGAVERNSNRELVIIDGSCTELRRLHSELALVDYGERAMFFSMLYPQAHHLDNPLQLIRNTIFEFEDLAVVHLLLRVEAGRLVFGREPVFAKTLLGDEQQQLRWSSALCLNAEVLCYKSLVTEFGPEADSIPSELVHPLQLPPVLMALEQEALVVDSRDTGVQVTESVLTLSPASGKIAAATVRISDGFVAGEDQLVYAPDPSSDAVAGMISGSFDDVTGVLELRGNASPMLYGEALKRVYFINNSANPADHLRQIEITVSDSGVVSNVMTRPVTVYPVDALRADSQHSQSASKGTFADAVLAIDCPGGDAEFSIIEPAYGFEVVNDGVPVFCFRRSEIERGLITLVQDDPSLNSGTIYLEVDDGSGAVFGVVVSVGKFGAKPDKGGGHAEGLQSPYNAEPGDLNQGGQSSRNGPDVDGADDRGFGT